MSRRRGAKLGDGRDGARAWCRALGVLGCACLVAGAQGQYYRPVQQDGRLFDANQRLGGSRYNAARPVPPLIVGNVVTTGNVRGGFAFRGFSPISDPTSFRGPLGSSTLAAFRRDSVSVADARNPYYGFAAAPYYDASRTVATGGFLSGRYAQTAPQFGLLSTGASRRRSPGGLSRPLDYRLSVGLPPAAVQGPTSLEAQIVGLTPTVSPELSSSIFGPAPSAAQPPAGQTPFAPVPRQQRRPGLMGVDWGRPELEEVPGSRPPLGTPLDLVQAGVIRRFPIEPGRDPLAQAEEGEGRLAPGPLPADRPFMGLARGPGWVGPPRAPGGEPSFETPRLRDVSVLPGYDVFTDMQLALSLSGDPGAGWFQDMQAAIQADPVMAEVLGEQARMQSQEFVQAVLDGPIQTFHGRGDSAKNEEMLKAEALLEVGRYYEAARRYDVAHSLDPLDPLPLIGKGNALLAAGDYLSATVALVQGFERYPELSRFRFDLPALIGGREIIDIRRADIMRRLAQQDDPRLQFLLGYLEYYAGDERLGESAMQHLDRAAELDRSGSIISRFPAMIRREGVPPPPRLPGATPLLPDGVPGGRVPGAPRNAERGARRGGDTPPKLATPPPQSPERKEP